VRSSAASVVAFPTKGDIRAQRRAYGYTRAREYHVGSFDVEPAIAEPVLLTEPSSAWMRAASATSHQLTV
jgi:hypothetical protein